jgi:hypothetical protein
LIERTLNNYCFNKIIFVNNIYEMRKNKYNYILKDGLYLPEKKVLNAYFKIDFK